MAHYICPYCDNIEQTRVSAAFHACNKERWQAKIDTLRAQNAALLSVAESNLSLAQNAIAERDTLDAQDNFNHSLLEKERVKNAELLAALKDCREELEQYESRLSGEDYSNPTLNALIQRAEGN